MEIVVCKHCNEENKTNAKYCRYCGYELPKPEIKAEVPEVQKPSKKAAGKKLGVFILSVVAGVLMYFVGQYIVESAFSIDKALMKMASEINSTCPIMVDESTRLDNTVALAGKTFQYNFSLVDLSVSEMDIEDFAQYMKPQIVNNIKTNPDMEVFKKNLFTLIYTYKDKEGKHVLKLTILPDDYLN